MNPTPVVSANGACPREEYPAPRPVESAPGTSDPQGVPLSLRPLDSPIHVVEEMGLPSTLDTFEAAWDLIAMMAPQSSTLCDKPSALPGAVPSRGKPMKNLPASLGYRSSALERGNQPDSQHHSESQHCSVSRHCSCSWHWSNLLHRSYSRHRSLDHRRSRSSHRSSSCR